MKGKCGLSTASAMSAALYDRLIDAVSEIETATLRLPREAQSISVMCHTVRMRIAQIYDDQDGER